MQSVGGPPKGVLIIAMLTVIGIGLTVQYRGQLRSESPDRMDRGSKVTMRVAVPPKGI